MFICDDCIEHNVYTLIGLRSYGNCEICGKTKSCVDYHGNYIIKPKPPCPKSTGDCIAPRDYGKLEKCKTCPDKLTCWAQAHNETGHENDPLPKDSE